MFSTLVSNAPVVRTIRSRTDFSSSGRSDAPTYAVCREYNAASLSCESRRSTFAGESFRVLSTWRSVFGTSSIMADSIPSCEYESANLYMPSEEARIFS